ncbi:MAG: glycosyltransferase [Candidatus Omnitrophica bacterium]|nr:glycosyltransferase [Candidatus Omnitrophota bacterium]
MPRVSVIIPYYNSEEQISETLRSLFEQKYKDYEIIIVDDGSNKSINLFDTRDIKYIRLENNKGPSAARNIGLYRAQGDFIQFIDSGDMLYPDKLSSQIPFLEENPDISFVFSDYKIIYQKYNFSEEVVFGAAQEKAVNSVLKGRLLHLNAMLFRRSILLELGGFDEGLRQCEDWDLWIRLLSLDYACRYLGGCFSEYVKRKDSITDAMSEWVSQLESMILKRRKDKEFLRKLGLGKCVFFSNVYFLAAWRLHVRGNLGQALKYYTKSLFSNPVIFVGNLFLLLLKAIKFAFFVLSNRLKKLFGHG